MFFPLFTGPQVKTFDIEREFLPPGVSKNLSARGRGPENGNFCLSRFMLYIVDGRVKKPETCLRNI